MLLRLPMITNRLPEGTGLAGCAFWEQGSTSDHYSVLALLSCHWYALKVLRVQFAGPECKIQGLHTPVAVKFIGSPLLLHAVPPDSASCCVG